MVKLPKVFLTSLILLTFVPTAFAVELPTQASDRTRTQASSRPSSSPFINARDRIQARTQEGVGVGNTNPDARSRACEARENALRQRSEKLIDVANNILSKFDSITERVKDFYQDKVVPSGKTVTNFDSLVSDIQTKKEDVETALEGAQTSLDEFSCDSGNPKEQMIQFREDMQNVRTALKDYRTSIKNLLVAVHSVTGSDNADGDDGSRPSISPRASVNPRSSMSPRPSRSPNANRGSDTGENEND